MQGKHAEAEKAYAHAMALLTPGDTTAMGRMAYAQFMLGSYEKALGLHRKVLDAYPGNVEMRAGLGWSLLKLQRYAEAKVELDRVLTTCGAAG